MAGAHGSSVTAAMDAASCVGTHDVLLITLDTLRYDVAMEALLCRETPNLAAIMPHGRWEKRHSPGNFTYAAHHAFFAGFLPTPAEPGRHPRLFAARFPGSETTAPTTLVFDAPDIVSGFAGFGYHTACIGGVGFFNKRSALGSILPGLFHESFWDETLGVACMESAANQVRCAIASISRLPARQRIFLFMNMSACHEPNRFYVPGAAADSPRTQRAALAYIDTQLPPLFRILQARAPVLAVICSDHGTAYGENGYIGHRLAHSTVWDVPYMETILPQLEVDA
jgi:hypothetical protein